MATYNVELNRFNGTSHDAVLPKNSLTGIVDPTTSTVGIVGQFYLNTASNPKTLWQCVDVTGGVYSWERIFCADDVMADATATLYGLDSNSTPNEALDILSASTLHEDIAVPVPNDVSLFNVREAVYNESSGAYLLLKGTKELYWSTDMSSFTLCTFTGISTLYSINNLAVGDGVFYILGQMTSASGNHFIGKSTDGVNFICQSIGYSGREHLNGLVYALGSLFICGDLYENQLGETDYYKAIILKATLDFTVTLLYTSSITYGYSATNTLYRIGYSPTVGFLAVFKAELTGSNNPRIISDDGITWTTTTTGAPTNTTLRVASITKIVPDGSRFYLLGETFYGVYLTKSGSTLTRTVSSVLPYFAIPDYNGSVFSGVLANSNRVVYSTNFSSWSSQSVPSITDTNANPNPTFWLKDRFYSFSKTSATQLLSSTDGINYITTREKIMDRLCTIGGRLLELYGATKIATGSYTGTGTYGSSNKSSLTFEFAPKMVIIMRMSATTTGSGLIILSTGNIPIFGIPDGMAYICTVSVFSNRIEWYSSTSADAQLNTSNIIYKYIAIG